MNRLSRIVSIAAATVALAVAGTGCGKGASIVKDVKLRSYNQDGDAYAEMKAMLNIGGTELPAIELPIADPRNPSVSYGRVAILPSLIGGAELSVNVNLTKVAEAPTGDATLPNGTSLPIGGLDSAKVISLPLGHTNARLYIAIDSGTIVLGTAIPVKEMDPLGRYSGGANLFKGFTIKKVRGIAGIFTSPTPGQNGFGLFVDASGLAKDIPGVGVARLAVVSRNAAPVKTKAVAFINQNPGRSKETKINKYLYKLSSKRQRLTVQ